MIIVNKIKMKKKSFSFLVRLYIKKSKIIIGIALWRHIVNWEHTHTHTHTHTRTHTKQPYLEYICSL